VTREGNKRASLVATTNLPFDGWTKVFSGSLLAKAVVDRLTRGAHIIETRTEFLAFRARTRPAATTRKTNQLAERRP
jgi:DNA replication protein DnaC